MFLNCSSRLLPHCTCACIAILDWIAISANMATIILENSRVRVGLLQVPCLVFSHDLAGHHVFDHMPATGSLPRSSAPSRYRLRCVVRRSVLPRERFSPMATFRTSGHVQLESATGTETDVRRPLQVYWFTP